MLECRKINKIFDNPKTHVLFDIDFRVEPGEFVSITGRSGSGKSTLLYIISSLDVPTSGEVMIDGHEMGKMSSDEIHLFRNERMGFIFQFHYLMPELTALENVLMPARKSGRHHELGGRAVDLLEQVGLGAKVHRFPKELSGGEQQRVAIARALIMKPQFIFADEPTGNLDSVNGNIIMEILGKIAHDGLASVIYVTHEREFASRADFQIELADGHIATAKRK